MSRRTLDSGFRRNDGYAMVSLSGRRGGVELGYTAGEILRFAQDEMCGEGDGRLANRPYEGGLGNRG